MEIPINRRAVQGLYKALYQNDIDIIYLPNEYWSQENRSVINKLNPQVKEIKEILKV